MARSLIVGMPRGRSLPLALGILMRLRGRGLYPLLFSWLRAFHFASGVLQVCLSTPGVLFPLFSVTRLTAVALAEKERVNMRCRAFALRNWPSREAFAILNCSFLTR